MKKKITSIMIVIVMSLVFALSFGGCTVQNTERVDDYVEGETNEDAPIQLTVATHLDKIEQSLMNKWITAYKDKNPNVGIHITNTILGMDNLKELNIKGLPDIIWTTGDGHQSYSKEGYFKNLADSSVFEGTDEFFDGFYDAMVDTTHYDDADTGKWFVPRDYNRLTVIYNKTLFEAMGIPLPQNGWTWEEFMETCETLQNGANGYSCTSAISWGNWAPIHLTMMANFGASYIDETTGEFGLDTPEGKRVYEWTRAFEDENDGYSSPDLDGVDFYSYSKGSTIAPTGMFVKQYAGLAACVRAANANEWELDCVSFPACPASDDEDYPDDYPQAANGKGYVGAGCSGYAISKACEDGEKTKAAWDFLKFCMSREGYDAVADLGILCPALKSMANEGKWTEFKQGGRVLNYKAFTDDSTETIGVNYVGAITDAKAQDTMVNSALEFWSNVGTASYSKAIEKFKEAYDSKVKPYVRVKNS